MCICVFVQSAISAFGKIFALQICAFCARRFLRVLQICAFVFCKLVQKLLCMNYFSRTCAQVKLLFEKLHTSKIMFCVHVHKVFHFLTKNDKISKKSKFPKMSENVPSVFDVFPKMSEKSSRVPEWYTSGSWPNAFDNTGWQKSPEYALIRIAAGAPDLAKSPNPPPDGPGRPRKSRHFSLRTEKLPDSAPGLAFAPQAEILSGAVFS